VFSLKNNVSLKLPTSIKGFVSSGPELLSGSVLREHFRSMTVDSHNKTSKEETGSEISKSKQS